MVSEIFHELNRQQMEAVQSINENILVMAPAGTGKTKTISSRCENIINSGVLPSEIMCLTFTNKACSEMRDRIRNSLKDLGCDIYIKTFHSFCFDVIKTEARNSTDISSDFMVFDEEDAKEIIAEVNKKNFPVRILESFIYEVKHFYITADYKIKNDDEKLIEEYFKHNKDSFIKKNLREDKDYGCINALIRYGHILFKKYNNILRERHGLDFSDLVVNCYEIFEDEDVVKRWNEKYKYIHVDEIQDTSILEYKIIKKIAKSNNLSIFGDTNQTIYGWRGSKPFDILDDFRKSFSPVKEIHLTTNYRSTQVLLKAAESYLNRIGRIYVGDGIYLDESNAQCVEKGETIEYRCYNTIEEEAMSICNIIRNKYINRLNKIAILTRSNVLNKEYSKIFESSGIPAFLVDEYKFFRRKEIKDVLAFIKLALNKYDVNSMKRISFEFISGVGDKTIEYIEKNENKSLGIRLTDFIEKSTIEHGDPYYDLQEGLKEGNVVVFDVESTGIDVNVDEIVQIAAIRINSDGSCTKFERFLIPSKSVGDSQKVHGFSDEYLKAKGISSVDALSEFSSFIDGAVIVGHNVQYDLSIMKSQMARLGLKEYSIKNYYDTLDMARKLILDTPNHKLSTLSDYIGVKVSPDHNAMNDILATKDVLLYMNEKLKDNAILRMRAMSGYRKRFSDLYNIMEDIRKIIDFKRPYEVLQYVYDILEVENHYKEEKRIDNLNELKSFFENNDNDDINPRDALRSMLTLTSLASSEIDGRNIENKVPIITVHQSKGLEFEAVFIAGLNEGDFPSYFSKTKEEMVEESRLFYVAITRAKKKLYLSSHKFNGRRNRKVSRFPSYIDSAYIDEI